MAAQKKKKKEVQNIMKKEKEEIIQNTRKNIQKQEKHFKTREQTRIR
jgi:hypothetical protein